MNANKGKFNLVTLDLDGTLFMENALLYVNKKLGINDTLVELNKKYHNGEISESELNKMQLPIIESASFTSLSNALSHGPLMKNIDEGVRLLKNHGLDVAMLTLNPLKIFFEHKFRINAGISNQVKIVKDKISCTSNFPDNKVYCLRKYCELNQLSMKQCIHVGNDHKDVPTFKEVGLSIAVNSDDQTIQNSTKIHLTTDNFEEVAKAIINNLNFSSNEEK